MSRNFRFPFFLLFLLLSVSVQSQKWIRINQLGYLPQSSKTAVMMSLDPCEVHEFEVIDKFSGKVAFRSSRSDVKATGSMGRMAATFRLNLSRLTRQGTYYIKAGGCVSPTFPINGTVYNGTADYVLRYMRQQRCGYNPFLRDSCHTKDAYIVYHPTKTGRHIDVRGGWHDASDCLQYTTTSANALYQMMFAYSRNPMAFGDHCRSNGLYGSNGIPDIVDEIYWGLDWLNRMNPEPGELYNQIADDRDHVGMRRPHDDTADYGYGPNNGRPVYFCSGKPQQRGKFENATTGVASTAGKFASAFSLGSQILKPFYPQFAEEIGRKAERAYQQGVEQPGCCQTASVRSPYIYEECNWTDDMELGAMALYRQYGKERFLQEAAAYGRKEPVTPWMGADTARHYQWYPFMNMGHYHLATCGNKKISKEFTRLLKEGIERTYQKAQRSPFLYGIPSIWCSNNLTVAMLTQCILYRQTTGDRHYEEMEGALRDWLFGCNPWGVSMIVELPLYGNYPHQPHSFVINMKLGNTTGGLVDGPVYTAIFNSLKGVNMVGGTNYEEFQPGKMVYHDSTHDYSTNEPTMDGTASLTFPLSTYEEEGKKQTKADKDENVYADGGIIRFNPHRKRICLVFTAADKADGAEPILRTLKKNHIHAGFFFTGEFYEKFPAVIKRLVADGHYVGSHSYGHLLYFPWGRPDTMLVSHEEFNKDIMKSYELMGKFGITKEKAPYFIPPYEHYNALVSAWAEQLGLKVMNYTPGTATNGDYTTPDMKNYYSSDNIMQRIMKYEREDPNGLNGHFLLLHFGTDSRRTDKFYNRLPDLINTLRAKGYEFVSVEDAIGLRMK